jgi:hypothetical protein
MELSYDVVLVGIGDFGGARCEHEGCQRVPRRAVVYVEHESPATNAYLCARHFSEMVETVARGYGAAA